MQAGEFTAQSSQLGVPAERRRFIGRVGDFGRARGHALLLIALLVASLGLRLFWLDYPPGSLVFDEAYYVNAARVILGWPLPEGANYATAQQGLDPNTEHLPLVKVIIAGSMRIFGDNGYGWRIPSVLAGTAGIAILYFLAKRLTRRTGLALLAAFTFAFDNLVFVHGRIGTLDIFMLVFTLLGVLWYVERRPVFAGAAIGISTLAKFNGLLAVFAIIGFEMARFALRRDCREQVRRTAVNLILLIGSFVVVLLTLLWPLDHFFTTYANPVDHIAHVYNYGVGLRRPEGPQGIESAPWQWLINEAQIGYLKLDSDIVVDEKVVGTKPNIHFRGAMNPFVIALLPIVVAYLIQVAIRKREDFPLLMLSLMAVSYLQPVVAAVLWSRMSYLFYFLPVLPALSAGIAYFFVDLKLPRSVLVGYVASVLFGFVALFPFRMIF